jgi:mannosyltransferase
MRTSSPPPAPQTIEALPGGRQYFTYIFISAITVAAAFLRVLYLTRKSFWLDEGVSVMISRLDGPNLLHILWRREANMAFYYGLLRVWLHFGQGEFFVRSLSVAFSVAAIPVIYLLGKDLLGQRPGLIAASLLSVHAWHIRYAQEARSYSLFFLLALLSSLFCLRGLQSSTRRNWTAYVVFSTLAIYSHFFAVLVVLAQWFAAYFFPRADARADFARSLKIIGLLVLPLGVFIASRGLGPLNWIPRPGFPDLHRFALDLTGNGGSILLLTYFVSCVTAIAAGLTSWSVVATTVDVLTRNAAAGRAFSRQTFSRQKSWESTWRYLFLFSWLLVPVVLTLGFSLIKSVFLPRYMFACVAPLILLAADGVARLRPRLLAVGFLLALVAFSVRGTLAYYRADFDLAREDWRGATSYVLANALPGDGLIFHSAQARMPFEYYADSSPVRQRIRIIYPSSGEKLTAADFLANAKNADLGDLRSHYQRIWLVLAHNRLKDEKPDLTTGVIQNSLKQNFTQVTGKEFSGGIVVVLYRLEH